MKTRIAMMISIAGVLVAGSAAALVNTQVLGGSTAPSGLAVDAAAQTEQSTPTTTVTTAGTVPTTSVVSAAPVVNGAQPAAATPSTQAVYAIATAGSVTLDTAGDVLTIVNLTPAPGWTQTKAENQDTTNVEIKLQNGSTEAEFHANLLFGVVTTSIQSNDTSSTGVSIDDHGGTSSGHGGGSDDSGGHGSDD